MSILLILFAIMKVIIIQTFFIQGIVPKINVVIILQRIYKFIYIFNILARFEGLDIIVFIIILT